jgi:hypothetical protein
MFQNTDPRKQRVRESVRGYARSLKLDRVDTARAVRQAEVQIENGASSEEAERAGRQLAERLRARRDEEARQQQRNAPVPFNHSPTAA